MPSLRVASLSILLVAGAVFYQTRVGPLISLGGAFRVVEPLKNDACTKVEGAEACEKLVLHSPSGHVYMACSTLESRMNWLPYHMALNASGRSTTDHVAIYDPTSEKIIHTRLEGFSDARGINVHGMDVVPSKFDKNELFVYLVNHRPPVEEAKARVYGADSVIEIFNTKVGSDVLTHVKTVEDPLIDTPNDVVGSSDGKSFYFTNDHSTKTGLMRVVHAYLSSRVTNVAYCHVDAGCKIAAGDLAGCNGIARGKDGKIFVVLSTTSVSEIRVFEEQDDNSLVQTDIIPADRHMDNIVVDEDDVAYIASIPKTMHFIFVHQNNFSIPSPSSIHRLSLNTEESSFYGEKYKLEKIFEDDGSQVSAITSTVMDKKRSVLYIHGISAPCLSICKV
ncbi:hypothetical protein BOTBODRAFT_31939 [Botryobasidium botryosum FD-172 SS1]|uniref:SMP-30/Gluconolactonase/LRE-like region domain-containing protein n=1 Tax=Botryobasidium botryosum (strain FD-172 SS1) TaxID=930990 RepID=A0A067MUN9_BOTB1|nr:hypothetical protein BOTBODRAFT_31939 [Botryobasidium botryosum FD-172 SS1]